MPACHRIIFGDMDRRVGIADDARRQGVFQHVIRMQGTGRKDREGSRCSGRADKGAAGDQGGVFAGLFHRGRIAKPLTLGNADSAACWHIFSRLIPDA